MSPDNKRETERCQQTISSSNGYNPISVPVYTARVRSIVDERHEREESIEAVEEHPRVRNDILDAIPFNGAYRA